MTAIRPSEERVWMKHFPESSRNAEMPYRTIYETLQTICKKYPDNKAIYYYGTSVKYSELLGLVDRLAQAYEGLGVKAGDNGQDLGIGEIHFVFYTDKTKAEIDPELAQLDQLLQQRLAPLGMVSDGFYPTTRFFHYVFCEPDCQDILDYLERAKQDPEGFSMLTEEDYKVLERFAETGAGGGHACFRETGLIYGLYPELVAPDR